MKNLSLNPLTGQTSTRKKVSLYSRRGSNISRAVAKATKEELVLKLLKKYQRTPPNSAQCDVQ